MSPAARASQVFGLYLGLLGLILLVAPNTLLTLFAFAPTDEPWIRIVGFLVAILSHYYLVAAYRNDRIFFAASIAPRLLVLPTFGVFVFAGWAPIQLLGFALPDVASALWTRSALGQADG